MQARMLAPAVVVSLMALACGGDGRPPPETTTEMPPSTVGETGPTGQLPSDAGTDAGATADAQAPRVDCATPGSGIVCDDGVFCNGSERCEPAAVGADARGCVAGPPLACAMGETCSEAMRQCSPCSDGALDDADGDGHEAASCGGDDCRDDDASTFPGQAETCNGKDDDCDGAIDGAPADAACMAAAPAQSSSRCSNATCAIVCDDFDADLTGGACVKRDDCAGVTSCGPGSCVDAVRSYTCTCPSGYAGTGTTACSDVDECAATNDCDTSPAACVNTPGSYRCACPDTHFGDGMGAHGCTRKALQVAAGVGSTCAVLAGGSVKCWGHNAFGKLGISGGDVGGAAGQMGDALAAVSLGARSALAIHVGSDLSCALLATGAVKCWGYNGYGSLGGGDPGAHGLGMFDAPLPAGRRATAVNAGSGYGYAALDDGSLGRWGYAFSPYAFTPGARVRAFDRSPAYDRYHVCALLESGDVSCWPGYAYFGDPEGYGTLGYAFDESVPVENRPFIALGAGRKATQVALGNQHSCALLDDGSVKCWGRNDHGQLGLGDTQHRGTSDAQMGDALPKLALGAPVRAIAAGADHSCALLQNGSVKCWGMNDAGQLGQGHTGDIGDAPGELEALPAIDLGSGRTAVAIDVGAHSCAVLDNGGIKCWGANGHGELGQGDTQSRGASAGTLGDALKAIDVGE